MRILRCKVCKSEAEKYPGYGFENYLVTLDQGNKTKEFILCSDCFRTVENFLTHRKHKGLK